VVDDMRIKEMEKACRKVEVASTPSRKLLRTAAQLNSQASWLETEDLYSRLPHQAHIKPLNFTTAKVSIKKKFKDL
jgi:hypothetical protein